MLFDLIVTKNDNPYIYNIMKNNMKIRLLTILSICSVLVLSSFTNIMEDGWSLAREKSGIKIYTKKFKSYNYKEYKAVTIMDGTPSDLVKILKDVSTYQVWSYNCVANTAEVLKENKATSEMYIYMEIKAPIVANRDVIALYKFNAPAADGSITIDFEAVKDYIPKKNGKVRVPEMVGYWKAIPLEGGKMKVINRAFSHPGGNPPAGMVNGTTVNAAFYMLTEMRNLIEK